ncbi:unnamed protein product [Caenorhabditis nigoni]
MISLHSIILLLGLVAAALACAPHMPQRSPSRGYCKFYIDGSSDYDSARKKRDSSSSSSSSSSESGGSKGGKGRKGGGGGGKKFNRSKKKNTKCYEYEDGSKDQGAVLNKGVKYTVVVTKGEEVTTVKPKEVKHGLCLFYIDGTSDVTGGRKKRSTSKVFTTTKKKSTKCYEYEDGTKDEGAVLNKGVTYTVTVTKEVIE